MVKTPRTRHSKSEREPVTIELGPDDVSHLAPEEGATAEQAPEAVKEDIGASEAAEPLAEPSADIAASDTPPEAAREPDTAFADEPKPAASEEFGRKAKEEPRLSAQPEPQVPPPSRPSRGSALIAGLAGGVVALVAGGLLQFAGILGSPGSGGSAAPAVEGEIAALKSEIEGLKTGAGNVPGDLPGQVDGLSQALDQVKADVASLKQAVELGGAGGNAGIEALNTEIAELETRIDSIGPGTDGATPEEVAAINEKIAGVEALARAAGEAGSALDGRLGAIEQSLSGLTAKVDSQAAQPKIALAIAASALKAAIERGAPFQPEIETFAAIAPQAPGLADSAPMRKRASRRGPTSLPKPTPPPMR